jgi:hypothetical protein
MFLNNSAKDCFRKKKMQQIRLLYKTIHNRNLNYISWSNSLDHE